MDWELFDDSSEDESRSTASVAYERAGSIGQHLEDIQLGAVFASACGPASPAAFLRWQLLCLVCRHFGQVTAARTLL